MPVNKIISKQDATLATTIHFLMVAFSILNLYLPFVKKLVGYILAFMVLGFSLIPCADGSSLVNAKAKYELTSPHSHEDDRDHKDECSPFCICSCCAGFSVAANLLATGAINMLFQPTHSSYIPQGLFSIARPIWQPPRLL